MGIKPFCEREKEKKGIWFLDVGFPPSSKRLSTFLTIKIDVIKP